MTVTELPDWLTDLQPIPDSPDPRWLAPLEPQTEHVNLARPVLDKMKSLFHLELKKKAEKRTAADVLAAADNTATELANQRLSSINQSALSAQLRISRPELLLLSTAFRSIL